MAETGISREQLCDTVATELALGFSEDILTYDYSDHLADVMFGWLVEGVVEGPTSTRSSQTSSWVSSWRSTRANIGIPATTRT